MPAQGSVSPGVRLRLLHDNPANPEKGWVRSLHFAIHRTDTGAEAGTIDLRLGTSENLIRYAGQIGYSIHVEHRGHHFAGKACLQVAPLALAHGMDTLWITCSPNNIASRRTCLWLGATLVETVDLPPDNDQYLRGERKKCRYRWDLL